MCRPGARGRYIQPSALAGPVTLTWSTTGTRVGAGLSFIATHESCFISGEGFMFRPLKWGRVAFAILSAAGTPGWGAPVGFAYVTSLGSSGNVSAYNIEGRTGALTAAQRSPFSA